VQATTLCPVCYGVHTYRPGLENSLSQRADKPTFSMLSWLLYHTLPTIKSEDHG
jgi:hypothetical protein